MKKLKQFAHKNSPLRHNKIMIPLFPAANAQQLNKLEQKYLFSSKYLSILRSRTFIKIFTQSTQQW